MKTVLPDGPDPEPVHPVSLGWQTNYVSVSTVLALLLGAALVGIVWACVALSGAAPTVASIRSDSGGLNVGYMIQTSSGSAEGSKIDQVARIDFHPNYVVVNRRDGSGRVFFTGTTRDLNWARETGVERTVGH